MNTKVIREISTLQRQLLYRLDEAGLDEVLTKRVVDSEGNDLATEMVQLVRDEDRKLYTSLKHAYRIMGKNFFGLTEAKKYFGITLTEKQVTALEKVPWSKDILKACKDTHILVLVFPVSILNLRHMVDYDFFAKHNDAKYNKKKFAKHDGEAGWYLVLKTAVSDSFEKKLDVQQKLLSDNDEVCSAQVMVYITVACRLANGEVLFPNIYVRTSDIDGSGHCVAIGHDKKERLCIDLNWRPNHKLSYTGLSCGKKRRMK